MPTGGETTESAAQAGRRAGTGGCVLVSGASGLVGRMLVPFLEAQGHSVRRLVRRPARAAGEFCWDPAAGVLDPAALAGVDAVVHLAGENIAGGRWTAARREAIGASRIQGTRTLAAAIAAGRDRPEVLVSASAVGLYGDRGDDLLGEDAKPGRGFLAEVCADWEREASAVAELGVRTVLLRAGVVLAPEGGALGKMLPAFRAGIAGRLGPGRQWMSWVGPDDLVAMFARAVRDRAWRGAYNAVSPEPVTNAEFTAVLSQVLRRPAVLPVPAWALRLMFGRMAEETLLPSTRAVPARLQAAGFAWKHPRLEDALRHVLGRPGPFRA